MAWRVAEGNRHQSDVFLRFNVPCPMQIKNNGMLFGDIQCLSLTLDPTASIKVMSQMEWRSDAVYLCPAARHESYVLDTLWEFMFAVSDPNDLLLIEDPEQSDAFGATLVHPDHVWPVPPQAYNYPTSRCGFCVPGVPCWAREGLDV